MSTFVLDTFTRTGDGTTDGEAGANYTALIGALASIGINGSAAYVVGANSTVTLQASGQPSAGQAHAVEGEFEVDADATTAPLSQITLKSGLNGSDTSQHISFYVSLVDGYLYFDAEDGTNDTDDDIGDGDGPLSAGVHTARLEVDYGANEARAYIDGVLKGTLDLTALTALPDPPFVGVDLRELGAVGSLGGGTNSFELRRFQASDIATTPDADLDLIEAADTIGASTTVTTGASIGVTEAPDAVSITTTSIVATIAATEAPDSTFGGVRVTTGAATAAAERPDVAALTGLASIGIIAAEAPDVVSLTALSNRGQATLALSGYEFFGVAHVDFGGAGLTGARLELSGYTLTARTGAVARLALSGYSLTASATAPVVARAVMRLSGYALNASATVSNRATASLELSGYSFSAYTGAVARLAISGYSLTANGRIGGKASAILRLSGYTLTAAAQLRNRARAVLELSGYTAPARASAIVSLSGYSLAAEANLTVAVEYEGYAATVMQDGRIAVTHYTNFPFTQFFRFNGQVYGVASDGLYALGGDTDDGEAIEGVVELCPTDFGARSMKRPRSVFVYGKLDGEMEVACIVDQDQDNAYTYQSQKSTAAAHRVLLGRGVKGSYLGFRFTSSEDFRIDAIEPEIDVLKRAIWE